MPKEKSINPAQAQRKADKAKAVKKGKAEQLARRTEKLAKQNPERLQKQLDDLKAIESSGGKLTSHERTVLEGLERDIKLVRKARETLGDKAPPLRRYNDRDGDNNGARGGSYGGLGKRRRDENGREITIITGSDTEESDVPDEVARIPMPRDTPPPVPKAILDKWHNKRRERLGISNDRNRSSGGEQTGANRMPLGAERRVEAPKTVQEAKTVYSAAPEIRDLRKEAVSAFIPAAVREKMQKSKGTGGALLEPEEADRLEREGYLPRGEAGDSEYAGSRKVAMEEVEDEDD